MARLIPDADIKAYLPTRQLSADQLAAINTMVAGWLREATGQVDLPDPLPPTHPLYSAAFELIVQTAINPEGLVSITNGPTTRTFADSDRRAAILAGLTSTSPAAQPAGTFPEAPAWPDAAEPARRWR